MCAGLCECRYPMGPAEGTRRTGAEGTGGCGCLTWVLGTERAAPGLNLEPSLQSLEITKDLQVSML